MFHCDNLRWASMDPLQWCTTLSPPDLDGAPRSPRRISTVHHAEKEKRRTPRRGRGREGRKEAEAVKSVNMIFFYFYRKRERGQAQLTLHINDSRLLGRLIGD